jgi:phosphatidylethanolamine/phosphatidyl-N-methylethanolamine N-methyltransferase
LTKTKENLKFFLAAVARPWRMGAIAPSSRDLAEQMLKKLNFGTSQKVLEVGPGTGAITELVLPRLKNPDQYLGLEINEDFVTSLHQRFPGVKFVNDSAENASSQVDTVDYIVCSLPWSMWGGSVQEKLLQNVSKPLTPGSTFATYAYWPTLYTPTGRGFRKLLGRTFSTVETSQVIWKNLPPAVIYLCSK